MQTLTLKHILALLLIASATLSCQKGDDAPGKPGTAAQGEVSYFAKALGTGTKATAIKSAQVLTDSMVAVNWSSASIWVEKISFVGMSNKMLDTTIIVGKNMNIFDSDALAGVFKLPSGSYTNVKVKLLLRKSPKSELAFYLKGTFENSRAGRDTVVVASSLPFEANIAVNDFNIQPQDNYKVVFNFNLDRVLAGIKTRALEHAVSYNGSSDRKTYYIWKGGSDDVPFYQQVSQNWQTVASVVVLKQ
ncbi:hypothetical protein [Pedobacter sp. SYSU D00535]|uniref:hypothetical protein n=1 Tax=Pedobacter sp. SYSU D00535 TaxID=2810308 RepID=UPI001A96606A|nr:hypothetical protein [Pedobacter sp. SYSU D00535]